MAQETILAIHQHTFIEALVPYNLEFKLRYDRFEEWLS
jgi:hypothetical protein